MDKRQQELTKLKDYIENIDKETTLLLQNLQWDNKHLIGSAAMVSCKYVSNHRIPVDTSEAHEKQCYLIQHGYKKEDLLLPDPIDPDSNTLVKLSRRDIMQIINIASTSNPSFQKATASISQGVTCVGPEPLSLERLQQVYTADERRAIHDIVVSAAPFCHNLADLALSSTTGGRQSDKAKSRMEILAELRDMKRRRTKYRVAAKTANYSDMLRDVIKTQMELYAEAKGIFIKTEYGSKTYVSLNMPKESTHAVTIKEERISPEVDNYSDTSRRYRERSKSRDKHYDNRKKYDDREREPKRRHYDDKGYSTEKRTYKDRSQERDKYASKERRRYDEGQLQRGKRIKEEVGTSKDRHEDWRKPKTQERSSTNDSRRNGEDRRKHNRNLENDFSRNKHKYPVDSRGNEKRDRGYKDGSSNDGTYEDYYRKQNGYQKRYKDSDRHREQKYKLYDCKVKEEKGDDW